MHVLLGSCAGAELYMAESLDMDAHSLGTCFFVVQDRAASVRQGRAVQQVKYSKARKGQAVQRGQGQAVSAVAASTMFGYSSQKLGQQSQKKLRRSRQAHCKRPS